MALSASPAGTAGEPTAAGVRTGSHALRLRSLVDPARGVTVPCDAAGRVDLDGLTERLRNAYLGARAMVGRDYARPVVEPPG